MQRRAPRFWGNFIESAEKRPCEEIPYLQGLLQKIRKRTEMKNENIIIFTDGASKGNPGPGGWGAIVSLPKGRVTELGGGEAHTTNNKMELCGVIFALEFVKNEKESIIVNTDSSYVINGITKWVHGWQKNNWKTKQKSDVLNKDVWQRLVAASEGKNIEWHYVGGHVGIAGNERCDEIATGFAKREEISLYDGDVKEYPIDLSKSEAQAELLEKKSSSKARSNTKAYSYLSMVNGKITIDHTWAECEKRVKGVKGVKFKKSLNRDEEQEIIASWLNQSR